MQDGSFADPGAALTLKFDNTVAGDNTQTNHKVSGSAQINTVRSFPMYTGGDSEDYYGYQSQTFESLAAKSGVTIPMLLKLLGIAPPGAGLEGDILYVRNNGERLPLRGGNWVSGAGAGVFALYLNAPRARSNELIGFRAAFVNL